MQNPEKEPPKPAASDTPTPEPPPPDTDLGQVGAGPHDTELGSPAPRTPTSHRKGTAATPTGQPAPPDADRLALPRGGLVAMRQSGGLRFRSREIVIYRSGKLVYRRLAPTSAESASHTRQLALSELVELHHLLKQIDFSRLPTTGRQNPDAFAYEIVARPARRAYAVEVFQGSIPESLAPLIRALQALMPKEDVGENAPATDAPEIDE
jgi:hypothetical protein